MTPDQTNSVPGHPPLRRSPHDRVLGGVCAGIAHRLGVDPLLIRIAAVVLGLVSAGAAVFVYLAAWVLMPHTTAEPRRVPPPAQSPIPTGGARDAWTAAGGELKSLADGLRQTRPAPATNAGRPGT